MQTSLLLEMGADCFPDRIAITHDGDSLTLAELSTRAHVGAAWLQALGHENVAYIGLNSSTFPITLFACAFAGKPFVPLNYRLTDIELRALIERAAPVVVIVDDDMASRVLGLEGATIVTSSAFDRVVKAGRDKFRAAAEADVAILLFTSGTTGSPKAAVLRHRHLTSYVIGSVEFMAAEENEAALVSVPSYHIAGISAALTGIYAGRRIVYLSAFSPNDWVEMALKENISHAMVVPTMLGRILDVLEEGIRLPALKVLSYGGGRMPLTVIERALRLLPHVDFVNAYGLTETSSTIALLGPEDHRAAYRAEKASQRRRLGSVGRALPMIELEIRGIDGTILPHGECGEIYVRGDQVAGEYLHARVIGADGWFGTKDSGWLDDEGYLFLDGRMDDVIVRGGENISPGEIEDVLRTHPAVADLAVFGLPDDQWGERVAAVIVPRGAPPAIEELSDWVRMRLRSTKTPETWAFRSELPYNEMGKLLRRVLKQEAAISHR